jgi:hypothetical protein
MENYYLLMQLKLSTQREAALRGNLSTLLYSDQMEQLTRQSDDQGRDIQWTTKQFNGVSGRLKYPLPSY